LRDAREERATPDLYDLHYKMPGWLADFLNTAAVGAISAVVLAAVSGSLYMRRARKRLIDLQVGKPATFYASLRANTAPFPRRWRAGWLTVNAGPPSWRPRFSLIRRPIVLPMSATVEEIRAPAGLREGLIVNTESRIMVARAGDVTLELAVFPIDLRTAMQALETGSAVATVRPPQ